jgi:hypothetical protein
VEPFDWSPFLAADDESSEAAHARWHAAGLVDGLPIVPPTAARVRALYRRAGLDPVRQLGTVEPSQRPVTGYDAAVCAVAAGCRPEHLAIVAAAVRAVCEPAFNLLGIQTTTGTAAPAIVVHGPAAIAAGVSGGADCLGGSAVANATIGRALRIVLRSVGGAATGGMDAATMGQPAKLGLCFAENVERSPWPELHVDVGFPAGAGAVTVVGISGSVEIVYAESDDPDEILAVVAAAMLTVGSLGSAGLLGGASPLVVLSPEHAGALARAGLSRRDVQGALWTRARLPVASLPSPVRLRRGRLGGRVGETGDPSALTVAAAPEDILVAVAGGVGVKSTYLPSWGGGTRAVTVPVE